VSHNPYAPPATNVADVADHDDVSSRIVNGLYSSRQLFFASFIGSPIAAAWFAASNFRKLGEQTRARNIVLWGTMTTIAVMIIAFILPDRIPHSVFPLLYSLAIRMVAVTMFDPVVKEQKVAGATGGSSWTVVGVSFLWMLLVLAILAGIAIVLEQFGVQVF